MRKRWQEWQDEGELPAWLIGLFILGAIAIVGHLNAIDIEKCVASGQYTRAQCERMINR